MTSQHDALLRLLRDDDPETLALIKAQLADRGLDALPAFRELLATADPAAARHLGDVIARIESREAGAIFALLCATFGDHGDLEQAAWRLAAVFLPGENFSHQQKLLEAWAAEVSRRLEKAGTDVDRIETLVEFLAHDARLRGNEEDYYNLANSLLPEVIDTRRGIPITLSLVYFLVGKRAGIPISGVGLPGHFLIQHGFHFFDPFNGGKRLGLEECRMLVEAQGLALTKEHLQPVTSRQFLARMLNNIRCLAEPSDPPLAAKVSEWLEALSSVASAH